MWAGHASICTHKGLCTRILVHPHTRPTTSTSRQKRTHINMRIRSRHTQANNGPYMIVISNCQSKHTMPEHVLSTFSLCVACAYTHLRTCAICMRSGTLVVACANLHMKMRIQSRTHTDMHVYAPMGAKVQLSDKKLVSRRSDKKNVLANASDTLTNVCVCVQSSARAKANSCVHAHASTPVLPHMHSYAHPSVCVPMKLECNRTHKPQARTRVPAHCAVQQLQDGCLSQH